MLSKTLVALSFSLLLMFQVVISANYEEALSKSLLFFEAQRSGKLPSNQRVQWRGDSGLNDGKDEGVDLVGGYYYSGDNVKYGFPTAFAVTMLAWSVLEFGSELHDQNQLSNAVAAIKWGTDYFIKAHPSPKLLYGEVGDGDSDHACWQRPEEMTTPRTCYNVNDQKPGSDIAAETAAALAAASVALYEFGETDYSHYSAQLRSHAQQLFDFALSHRGLYQHSIPAVQKFYPSSGDEDELLWAAAWLHRATLSSTYLDFINAIGNTGGNRSIFSWDDKYVGAQLLILNNSVLYPNQYKNLEEYKGEVGEFVCNCIGKGNNNVERTKGGLLWWKPINNLQYVTSAIFVTTAYANFLTNQDSTLNCSAHYNAIPPINLIHFVQSQVDYILGSNPKGMSYMVGYGSNYPKRVHNRRASIVSIKKDNTTYSCKQGYEIWYNKDVPNPNILQGAIVGGPDLEDNYTDSIKNYEQGEATIGNTAPIVGVLGVLAFMY